MDSLLSEPAVLRDSSGIGWCSCLDSITVAGKYGNAAQYAGDGSVPVLAGRKHQWCILGRYQIDESLSCSRICIGIFPGTFL